MSVITNYNPDVLTCLANLSNDEVFTPPQLVNEILDIFPKELWSNENSKFLDPVCKSGVFLREIVKRLDKGLEKKIPNKQKRIDHILKNQVFGVAITELTSLLSRRTLYCSKYANTEYSITNSFKTESGNIHFSRVDHEWASGKCSICGANETEYTRDPSLESHAYEFLHTKNIGDILKMKFDVIIGNPPYQLDTGGSGRQAKPIYQLFVTQAKKLNPKYLCMIIPARWFSGGFGLDKFRNEMLSDRRISHLVDFENASDVFPGVDIAGGVCYFLWERDHDADCKVTSNSNGTRFSTTRRLDEFDIFIRQSKSIPIINKVVGNKKTSKKFLDQVVSSIQPFGIPTNYEPKTSGIPCRFIQKIGLKFATKSDITDTNGLLNKWKLLIPKAPIAGQTDFGKPIRFYHDRNAIISDPGECCTESWIVAGAFDTKSEALSFRSYLFTKIVRFLILQTVISQDVNRKNFRYVPDLGVYQGDYTDEILCNLWGITQEEWEFIDSRILPANG
ncbi:Eco57I restriction-modification methylase domain-containing protein [Polynucleobacter sp. P1-05-14]|uniref:Eco57I restriction-modification methylase domain-containing protein n=1 Tax=Polynucleobacter sp. P1-05-14 TaxID=1819732 RepID=UPI001C0AF406|nr:Eco57I restriction-modification methylase domain-containing protein [Polynucleobacter sp. P1-05-14]MBU3548639.1 Eco57I restriction-modification methylase domain-containing protein [Polynucleobacter sp. P1-05-14]